MTKYVFFSAVLLLASSAAFATDPVKVFCQVTESAGLNNGNYAKQTTTNYAFLSNNNVTITKAQLVVLKDLDVSLFASYGTIGGAQKLEISASIADAVTEAYVTGLALIDTSSAAGSSTTILVYTRKNKDAVAVHCTPSI